MGNKKLEIRNKKKERKIIENRKVCSLRHMANVRAVLTKKSPPTVAICPHFTSTLASPSFSTPNILAQIVYVKFGVPINSF